MGSHFAKQPPESGVCIHLHLHTYTHCLACRHLWLLLTGQRYQLPAALQFFTVNNDTCGHVEQTFSIWCNEVSGYCVCRGNIWGRENIVFTVLLGVWILDTLTISVCTTVVTVWKVSPVAALCLLLWLCSVWSRGHDNPITSLLTPWCITPQPPAAISDINSVLHHEALS